MKLKNIALFALSAALLLSGCNTDKAAITEACILALILSFDSFAASFAYGSDGIQISSSSVCVISVFCCFLLWISVTFGKLISPVLNSENAKIISFFTLFLIGIFKLLDNAAKAIIRSHEDIRKDFQFSLFSFRFVLNIYADPEAADADKSKSISPLEALSVAAALSIDGIAAGFGAAVADVNAVVLVSFSLIFNFAAIFSGSFLGRRSAENKDVNLSWISGAVLILIAVSKLL